MTSTEAMITLNMLECIGPITVRRLIEEFGEPEKILVASESRLKRIQGINDGIASAISTWEKTIDLSAELKRCESYGCEIVSSIDPTYPRSLKQIYDPPIVLYVRGTLVPSDDSGVAIVGSRRSTNYGRETARKRSIQLAAAGVTVVSGGARGIDSSAHQGALFGQGRTLCILGHGINLIYPPENRDLYEQISQKGAILTQFPFNRRADRQTFPIRNRIVAGMTLGTLVIEADAKSGALITANMANDYGRQVFAVPGPIHSPRSKGCHRLIKDGAKLCESVDDILSEFEFLFPSRPNNRQIVRNQLDQSELKILELVQAEAQHIDDIVRESGFSVAETSVTLLQLEMKGFIAQRPGHIYASTRSS